MNTYEQRNRDLIVKTLLSRALTWSYLAEGNSSHEESLLLQTTRDNLCGLIVEVDNGNRNEAIAGILLVASTFRTLGYDYAKAHFLLMTALEVYNI